MKVVIFAAGYGTRLYPLTKNKAKPLLPIGKKLIIDYIIEKISEIKKVNKFFVTINKKFEKGFRDWRKGHFLEDKIKFFVNNSEGVHHEVSPLNDLASLLEKEKIDDDLIVIAGDNLFEFDFKNFIEFSKKHKGISIVVFKIKKKEDAKRFGVVELKGDKIGGFEEKPKNPKTRFISSAIYFFPKNHLKLIKKIGKSADPKTNIGHLIIDLFKTEDIFAYVSDGKFFDIGVIDDYKKANEIFG